MVLEDVGSGSDSARAVTSMSEIRRHKALLLSDFNRQYPDWEWSERRKRDRLMWDVEGRAWVPMFDPEYSVPYAYDEPGFTAAAEEALVEESRRALDEVRAGRFYTLDDLDAEDANLGAEERAVD